MEDLLKGFVGRQIDVGFGSASLVRGDVLEIRDGILYLQDEHKRTAHVVIEKIAVVWQCDEAPSRPGFIV
jgi:hypothetical protein